MALQYALGLTEEQYAKGPRVGLPPRTLHPSAAKLWDEAVKAVKVSRPQIAWNQALEIFLGLCDEHKLYPLRQSTSVNDKLLHVMTLARRKVVDFIEEKGYLSFMKVLKVNRSAHVSAVRTLIIIDAECRIDDPKNLDKLLHGMGGRKAHGWSRELTKGLEFRIWNDAANMNQRWHIEYRLTLPYAPVLPGKYFPSQTELEKAVLSMYLNILRAIRPIGSTRSLL